jgi:hypothetical protein
MPVIQGFRRFACLTLAISFLAGLVPYTNCKTAACAQTVECASMPCCCPCNGAKMQKKSQGDSHESQSVPNSYCPKIANGGTLFASPTKQIEMPLMAENWLQPLIVAPVSTLFTHRILESQALRPSTLVSMHCALTI